MIAIGECNRRYKADLELRDARGRTVLNLACELGLDVVASMLLKSGAEACEAHPHDPSLDEQPCDHGFAEAIAAGNSASACDMAARGEILSFGAEPLNGWTPIHISARSARADAIEALVASNHPLESRDHQGRTCLMLAAEGGSSKSVEASVAVLQQLLTLGASKSARDKRGT